nr:maleylpyruvate isomerase family mycothiol-dependent enzyme [Herbidospora yilanensis]
MAGVKTSETWPLVHAERAALAGHLAALDDAQWATPSLCAGLTVREVLAHLTAGASLGPLRWMAGVLRKRFDFDAMVSYRLAQQLGASPQETLDRFRRVVTSTVKAPIPVEAVLGEAIVHGADIRRPLGIGHDSPMATLTLVAGYYAGSDMVVEARGRISGLRLRATDGEFAIGSGPLVTGPTLALIMAMTGRAAFLDDLDGPGVATLRERSA